MMQYYYMTNWCKFENQKYINMIYVFYKKQIYSNYYQKLIVFTE